MNLAEKILKEYEADVLDKKITNPETGHQIKVSSALAYDDSEPVKKKALQMVQSNEPEPAPVQQQPAVQPRPVSTPVVSTATTVSRSHKPKSTSYGISKECIEFLKSKGIKSKLNAYPQSFVKPEYVQINPEIVKGKNLDSTWVCKFPVIEKSGKEGIKTAYTAGFMKKSQVKKFKKIARIKEKDVELLEEKSAKLLRNRDEAISDAACVIKIILKTGLRIGSKDVDESDTGNMGVRTITKKNISVEGDHIKLNFLGKSYQENISELFDDQTAVYLRKKLKRLKPDDNVFTCSYPQIGKVMRKINPKGINVKDIRTYNACKMTKELLEDNSIPPPPLPESQKEIKKAVKNKINTVIAKVAVMLNNSPAMAKSSYIHPVVITHYLDKLGLEPKDVAYKHVTLESKGTNSTENGSKINLNEEIITTSKFLSDTGSGMDEMFRKYRSYGKGVDYSDISDEDSENCPEYTLPEWWDDENIILVPKNG